MESSTGSPFSLRPVYFFREHEHPHGFLSQWTHAPFTAPSPDSTATFMTFSTTEQYMMYHKAVLFKDPETAKQILLAHTPKQQKALGRKVKNFDEETWNAHREKIVEDGNWNKFSNSRGGTKLKDMLVETGDRELVEVGSLNAVDSIADPELEASPFDRRVSVRTNWRSLTDIVGTEFGVLDTVRTSPTTFVTCGAKICSERS